MNIGYTEAMKVDNFDCFAFHDVDLVPEDDRSVIQAYEKIQKLKNIFIKAWLFGPYTAISKMY